MAKWVLLRGCGNSCGSCHVDESWISLSLLDFINVLDIAQLPSSWMVCQMWYPYNSLAHKLETLHLLAWLQLSRGWPHEYSPKIKRGDFVQIVIMRFTTFNNWWLIFYHIQQLIINLSFLSFNPWHCFRGRVFFLFFFYFLRGGRSRNPTWDANSVPSIFITGAVPTGAAQVFFVKKYLNSSCGVGWVWCTHLTRSAPY